MNILLITPTGFRPEAFKLCMTYVLRQTQQQFEWMVIDDSDTSDALLELGKIHISKACGIKVHPAMNEPLKDGISLGRNIKEAFAKIEQGFCKRKPDIIFFIEDDDWYAPHYVETLMNGFVFHPDAVAVGVKPAIYYHVPSGKYRDMGNSEHASLCSMAIRAEMIPLMIQCIDERPVGFDVLFWQRLRESNREYGLINGDEHPPIVGIKGLPGRVGIGVGHRPDDSWLIDDSGRSYLASLIGLDEQSYRPFYLNSPN